MQGEKRIFRSRLFSQPIIATLDTYDVKNAPPFRALSYTWGRPYRKDVYEEDIESPPKLAATIVCNGKPIAITRNLFDGLSYLTRNGVAGLLWVDAICVNQEDLEERSSQVVLMSAIYSSASEVIVWLGPPKKGLDDLVWASTELLSAIQLSDSDSDSRVKDIFKHESLIDEYLWIRIGMDNPLDRLMRVAYFWRSCRWFSRAWVVQEVLLARDVRFFCGDTQLPFRKLSKLSAVLGSLGWAQRVATEIAYSNRGISFPWLTEMCSWRYLFDEDRAELFEFSRGRWKDGSELVFWLSVVLDIWEVGHVMMDATKSIQFLEL
jgi:Heterokaryon incompatibility protein (HET)